MIPLLSKYAGKLASAGLCTPDEPLLAALDDELSFSHAHDPRQPLMEQVFRGLNISALVIATPMGACQAAMHSLARQALAGGAGHVTPGDCETRTFLHDLPVADGLGADGLVAALGRRKGCLIVHEGKVLVAATGSVSPEQCFVTVSSMAFACLVAYFAEYLRHLREGRTPDSAAREEFKRIRALLDQDLARLPQDMPTLAPGPFADADQARAAMIKAGQAVVEYGLVDSSFGNVSCRQATPEGELLLISQTGSSLDELSGCIDPCRFDGTSCVGLTASSEYSAHKAIYEGAGPDAPVTTILHGHPRFAVVLSLDCPKLDCELLGQCHRACATQRSITDATCGLDIPAHMDIPIVPGEVGTGPFGLCNTMPPAIRGKRGVIVYGHGLFSAGAIDFRDAFATLMDVERFCREEYFRRVAKLGG